MVRRALLDALGLPALVLVTSMTGFGTLARASGFGLGTALAATAGIWGLPGQIALAEYYAAGSEALAVVMPACSTGRNAIAIGRNRALASETAMTTASASLPAA